MKRLLTLLLATSFATTAMAQAGFTYYDINKGAAPSTPQHLLSFEKKLYLYANDGLSGLELYWKDSTNIPQLTYNMNPGMVGAYNGNYTRPIAGVNGQVFFTAQNAASGEELFVYDGTNNPKIAWDINTGTPSSSPDNFTVLNNILYYRANTANEGYELHEFNTATNVEQRLTDIRTGVDSSLTGDIVAFNNMVIFVADDSTHGEELWSYNPLNQQVSMVSDINATGTESSAPRNLTVLGGKLYFSAVETATGRELYEYDGTNAPKRVTDINPGFTSGVAVSDNGAAFMMYNGMIYLAGRDASNETHLHSYDPANGNVALVHKINPSGSSSPQSFAVYDNRLFFAAEDGANGQELWAYDGNNNPALMVDICQGSMGSRPYELTVVGEDLYFAADDCKGNGQELFKYNYNTAGVHKTLFEGDVKLYPNPVRNKLKIEITLPRSEHLRVMVADMNGRPIYDTKLVPFDRGSNKLDIPMKNLPDGAYIYYIQNGDSTTYVTGKVIKQ